MITALTEARIIELSERLGKSAVLRAPFKVRLEGIPTQAILEAIPTEAVYDFITPEGFAVYVQRLPEEKRKLFQLCLNQAGSA